MVMKPFKYHDWQRFQWREIVANVVDLIDELAERPEDILDHLPQWVRILSEICRETKR